MSLTPDTKNKPAKLVAPVLRVSLQIIAGALTMTAIALTFLLWRLSEGPISLNFMRPHLAQIFNNDNSPHRIVFDDLKISWSEWAPYIVFQGQNITVVTLDEQTHVTIPQITIRLSVPAMLRGTLAFVRVDIVKPNLDFFIKNVTTDSLVYDTSLVDEYIKTPFTYLSQTIAQALSPNIPGLSLAHLEEITVSDPVLTVYNHSNAVLWRAASQEWYLSQSEHVIDTMLNATLTINKANFDVSLATSLSTNTRIWDVKIFFSDLFPSQLAQGGSNLEKLSGLDFPIAGSFSASFDNLSNIETIEFELNSPGGKVPLREIIGLTEEYNLTDTRISGQISPENLEISLQNIEGKIDEVNIYGSASLTNLQIDAHFNAVFTAIKIPIERLSAFWPENIAEGTRAWVLDNVKGGILDSASAYINFFQSDLNGGNLERDQFYGQFEISNTSVEYIKGLPPARAMTAQGWFDGTDLHIGIEKGKVLNQKIQGTTVDFFDVYTGSEIGVLALQSNGPLSDFLSIPHLSSVPASRFLTGNVQNINGLSEAKFQVQFPLIKDLAVEHLAAKGELVFNNLSLSLGQTNMWIEKLNISNGTGKIILDSVGVKGSGTALLNDVPIGMEWIKFFEAERSGLMSRATIRATISDKSIKPWKDWLPFATGLAKVEVLLTSSNNDSQQARVSVDTSELTISLPTLHFTKHIGVHADVIGHLSLKSWVPSSPLYFEIISDEVKGTAIVAFDKNLSLTKIDLEDISYKGELLDAQLFFTDGELKEIDLYTKSLNLSSIDLTPKTKPFRLQKGRISVGELSAGPYTSLFNTKIGYDASNEEATLVALESEELVLEKSFIDIFDDIRTGSGKIRSQPMDFSGSIKRVNSVDGGDLLNLHGKASFQSGRLIRARMEAYFNETDKIRIEITGTGTEQKIALTSDNAGKVLQILGLTSNLIGGKLYLEAKHDNDGEDDSLIGHCTIIDFHVTNTPILAQLLSISIPTNVFEILSGSGLPFAQLQVPFRYTNSSVEVIKARATGISLGITLNGNIDLNKKSANLNGTIIPAYLLNNIVGAVPVIGDILTGPEKEGIFAATYSARGPTNDLVISVNPLTVLAPGILRDLLNLFLPDNSQPIQ